MAIDINKTLVFRIISIENLEDNLKYGLYAKKHPKKKGSFKSIGSDDVIKRRDKAIVKCYPDTVVNEYVPFYFSVRTPMLFNIITGRGVPKKVPQEDIIYLVCKLNELAVEDFQWCYTNGNAASEITKFYKKLTRIDDKVDWHSVKTTDFRDDNADGDEDRGRKKHAEFLVKEHVPAEFIRGIVVLNETKKNQVEQILTKFGLNIPVSINPGNKFYF
ncbi:MAG TPA: DUF4433 domain-containing protein [Bacteroidia bacterium]|jgi:hypothetical protein|nr:DUF4433 domain-containing protein [Bacteroidia bacterium]